MPTGAAKVTVALALPGVAVPMDGAGGTTAVTVIVLVLDVPAVVVTAMLIGLTELNSVAGSVTCADVSADESGAIVCAPADPVTEIDTGA